MGYSHKHRQKKLTHLHYIIFLSLLNLMYSWPSQGTLEDCINIFVVVSFNFAAYNTEHVSHCLQTATATYTQTHTRTHLQ